MLDHGKKDIMSKFSRLLITSGCSFSDPKYTIYKDHNIEVWPELLAKELNVELLNVAQKGASNDYISNSVMDAVIDNLDREIIVCVLWTGSNRLNFFDVDGHVLTSNSESININESLRLRHKALRDYMLTNDEFWDENFDLRAVNFNLRCVWRLDNFLKQHNIKFYHTHVYSPCAGIVWIAPYYDDDITENQLLEQMERERILIENTPKNRYFSYDYFKSQPYTKNMKWTEDVSMKIPNNGHPNQKGHESIKESFMLLMESNQLPYDGAHMSSMENFVYD